MEIKSYLIKDTTKEERIALIREWVPADGSMDESDGMDLWDIYDDYIKGIREISEINASLVTSYISEYPEDGEQ